MGQARDLMDRVTAALVANDLDTLGKQYAPDAVAVTPDLGEIKGRAEIVEWMRQFSVAFPDLRFDLVARHEDGDTAIDEGYAMGTNTGPLATPEGELPATGKRIRLRECDICVARDGLIYEHHFYYDQMEFLTQLGLTPA